MKLKLLSIIFATILGVIFAGQIGYVKAQITTNSPITTPITTPVTYFYTVKGNILKIVNLTLRPAENWLVAARNTQTGEQYYVRANSEGEFEFNLKAANYVIRPQGLVTFVPNYVVVNVNKNISRLLFIKL